MAILRKFLTTFIALTLFFFFSAATAEAHCDTLNGPLVTAARGAVNKGNVNLVLIWVKKEDEEEVKKAFKDAQKVRKLGKDAEDLADRYFFETLVRLHRKGEGASYTGLKPADTKLPPVVTAVDKAFETGDIEPALQYIPEEKRAEIRAEFEKAFSLKNYDENDVEEGRKYIEGYMVFVHHALHVSQEAHQS